MINTTGGDDLRRNAILLLPLLIGVTIGAVFYRAPRRSPLPPPPPVTAAAPAPTLPAVPTVTETVARIDMARMQAHVEKLAGEIGVRHGGSPEERAAAEYVRRRLASYGYTVTESPVALPDGKTSVNVLAELTGDTPRALLVGAHLDSYGAAPGANDNASGVAVMLEVARLLRDIRPKYTLLFVGFGAEEHLRRGDAYHHFGSRAMAKDTALQSRLAGMVSLDMVGYGTVLRIDNQGWASDRRRDEIAGIARAMGLPARVGRRKPQSDHEAFERRHIPAAYLHWERDPAYHTRADVPARLQPDRLRLTAELMVRFLRNARDDNE